MDAFVVLPFAFLWKVPQQITVMKIQGAKSGDLSGRFEIASELRTANGFPGFRLRENTAALCQDTVSDTLDGVVISKIPGQANKSFLPRWPHRNILADFDFITFLSESIKKLPFCHGLAQCFIHIGTDNTTPCGALFLFRAPLAVVLVLY